MGKQGRVPEDRTTTRFLYVSEDCSREKVKHVYTIHIRTLSSPASTLSTVVP